ncbi:ATP-binding cassette domain-containing protein [Ruegeria sp. 2205SS24-7]|uniref:ATP-binding cassette domain-containing protein n=1 Tax=Ruegeria discodermiae TaxID=3064389 RepID=UPI00274042FE|nr:ATP-binding cassette domain-containing protein [Ruegeria sp. 2205SS24-7]MDP5219080.1 ATP-binding cassette domain-containing protein [Ruegeria sp. 2205SS24-7]
MVVELFPLVLEGAETSRRGKRLVGPVNLTLDGQGLCVVMGPNGAGKTTLLRLMHGTARLTGGKVRWACDTEEARHHQAFVFQRPIVLRRTVEDNLIYPLRLRGVARGVAREAARKWAKRVGLEPHLTRRAMVLSGGEQQKLALARALITDPALVFLDEPTASLDGRATREIEAILLQAKAEGTRLILSTHDMGQARRIADQVVFILGGKVHETGPAEAFFDGPQTPEARAFLKGDIVE